MQSMNGGISSGQSSTQQIVSDTRAESPQSSTTGAEASAVDNCFCFDAHRDQVKPVELKCGHRFHSDCLTNYVSMRVMDGASVVRRGEVCKIDISCPMCRHPLDGMNEHFTGMLIAFINNMKHQVPEVVTSYERRLAQPLQGAAFKVQFRQRMGQLAQKIIRYQCHVADTLNACGYDDCASIEGVAAACAIIGRSAESALIVGEPISTDALTQRIENFKATLKCEVEQLESTLPFFIQESPKRLHGGANE